jgi:hypothetical protein
MEDDPEIEQLIAPAIMFAILFTFGVLSVAIAWLTE